jgi:hypothetical protein
MMEHTGDQLLQFEEGNAADKNNKIAASSPYEEGIIHSDFISDTCDG